MKIALSLFLKIAIGLNTKYLLLNTTKREG